MRISLLRLLLFIAVFFVSVRGVSNNCSTTAGTFASWAALTWTCSSPPLTGPPGCSDFMTISVGTVVNISADVDYSACPTPIQLIIDGVMNFPTNGVRFLLPAGSSVTVGPTGAITKTFPGGGSSTLISVGGQNVWTAGDGNIIGGGTLPIDLLSFTATPNSKSVMVEWATATEVNNDFFTLERSADGVTFELLKIIDGAGNSNTVINYDTEDSDPIEGISYYRLKQTDFDGHQVYFDMVEVEFHEGLGFDFTISPNPNDGGNITLTLNADNAVSLDLVIFDVAGRPVYRKTIHTDHKGTSKFIFSLEKKAMSGIYTVSLGTAKHKSYAKMMVR